MGVTDQEPIGQDSQLREMRRLFVYDDNSYLSIAKGDCFGNQLVCMPTVCGVSEYIQV